MLNPGAFASWAQKDPAPAGGLPEAQKLFTVELRSVHAVQFFAAQAPPGTLSGARTSYMSPVAATRRVIAMIITGCGGRTHDLPPGYRVGDAVDEAVA